MLTFLCFISFLVIFLNILGQSLPETLMQEIAPDPKGEEHAIIVSSKFINYQALAFSFLGPCITICKAETREFKNQ